MYVGDVCIGLLSEIQKSALGRSQRRPVDLKGLALVSQAAEQGLGQLFIAEQRGPRLIRQIRGDDRGLASVALFHQPEEKIRLLGTQI